MDEKQRQLDFMEAQRIALLMNATIPEGTRVDIICAAYAISIGSFAAVVEGVTPVEVINHISYHAVNHTFSLSDMPPPVSN